MKFPPMYHMISGMVILGIGLFIGWLSFAPARERPQAKESTAVETADSEENTNAPTVEDWLTSLDELDRERERLHEEASERLMRIRNALELTEEISKAEIQVLTADTPALNTFARAAQIAPGSKLTDALLNDSTGMLKKTISSIDNHLSAAGGTPNEKADLKASADQAEAAANRALWLISAPPSSDDQAKKMKFTRRALPLSVRLRVAAAVLNEAARLEVERRAQSTRKHGLAGGEGPKDGEAIWTLFGDNTDDGRSIFVTKSDQKIQVWTPYAMTYGEVGYQVIGEISGEYLAEGENEAPWLWGALSKSEAGFVLGEKKESTRPGSYRMMLVWRDREDSTYKRVFLDNEGWGEFKSAGFPAAQPRDVDPNNFEYAWNQNRDTSVPESEEAAQQSNGDNEP